ncbi:MAG: HIT domain-containing protein [Chromatiales bacterium]|nr:HIT domain-containing protein [Chromatiales bacterium]
MFTLHPQLERDTIVMGELSLSLLLLLNDARYPWFVLVPRREGITEIFQLEEGEQQQLLRESSQLGRWMMEEFSGDKLNIGVLGNLVPQLHLHHIVRFKGDETWPGPVWGVGEGRPYDDDQVTFLRQRIGRLL